MRQKMILAGNQQGFPAVLRLCGSWLYLFAFVMRRIRGFWRRCDSLLLYLPGGNSGLAVCMRCQDCCLWDAALPLGVPDRGCGLRGSINLWLAESTCFDVDAWEDVDLWCFSAVQVQHVVREFLECDQNKWFKTNSLKYQGWIDVLYWTAQRLNPLRQSKVLEIPMWARACWREAGDGPFSEALPDFVYDCQGRLQDDAAEDDFGW